MINQSFRQIINSIIKSLVSVAVYYAFHYFIFRNKKYAQSKTFLVVVFRNYSVRIVCILLLIPCIYDLGRMPSPILTYRLSKQTPKIEQKKEGQEEADVEIDTASEMKRSKDEKDPSSEESSATSFVSKETDFVFNEKPNPIENDDQIVTDQIVTDTNHQEKDKNEPKEKDKNEPKEKDKNEPKEKDKNEPSRFKKILIYLWNNPVKSVVCTGGSIKLCFLLRDYLQKGNPPPGGRNPRPRTRLRSASSDQWARSQSEPPSGRGRTESSDPWERSQSEPPSGRGRTESESPVRRRRSESESPVRRRRSESESPVRRRRSQSASPVPGARSEQTRGRPKTIKPRPSWWSKSKSKRPLDRSGSESSLTKESTDLQGEKIPTDHRDALPPLTCDPLGKKNHLDRIKKALAERENRLDEVSYYLEEERSLQALHRLAEEESEHAEMERVMEELMIASDRENIPVTEYVERIHAVVGLAKRVNDRSLYFDETELRIAREYLERVRTQMRLPEKFGKRLRNAEEKIRWRETDQKFFILTQKILGSYQGKIFLPTLLPESGMPLIPIGFLPPTYLSDMSDLLREQFEQLMLDESRQHLPEDLSDFSSGILTDNSELKEFRPSLFGPSKPREKTTNQILVQGCKFRELSFQYSETRRFHNANMAMTRARVENFWNYQVPQLTLNEHAPESRLIGESSTGAGSGQIILIGESSAARSNQVGASNIGPMSGTARLLFRGRTRAQRAEQKIQRIKDEIRSEERVATQAEARWRVATQAEARWRGEGRENR